MPSTGVKINQSINQSLEWGAPRKKAINITSANTIDDPSEMYIALRGQVTKSIIYIRLTYACNCTVHIPACLLDKRRAVTICVHVHMCPYSAASSATADEVFPKLSIFNHENMHVKSIVWVDLYNYMA